MTNEGLLTGLLFIVALVVSIFFDMKAANAEKTKLSKWDDNND